MSCHCRRLHAGVVRTRARQAQGPPAGWLCRATSPHEHNSARRPVNFLVQQVDTLQSDAQRLTTSVSQLQPLYTI